MDMLQRSREDFFEHIDSKDFKTIIAYRDRINDFERFCEIKFENIDIIDKFQDKEDQLDVFQRYVNWTTKKVSEYTGRAKSPSTVWNYAASIRKYTYYRGWQIAKGDLSDLVELPKKHEKELHGLKLPDIHVILGALSFADRLLHSFDAVSGTRIGESVQLRKKHFSLLDDRIMLKIPSTVAKFRRARTTFVTKEVGVMLMARLKRIDDNDLVFGTRMFDEKNTREEIHRAVHSSETTKEDNLRRVLDKVGLGMRYDDTGRYKINTHSFRSWFITKMSRHDPNLTKLLAGEKGYLLQYDRLSDEEKLIEYKQFESSLILDDSARKQAELDKVTREKSDLEAKNEELKIALKKVDELWMDKQRMELVQK